MSDLFAWSAATFALFFLPQVAVAADQDVRQRHVEIVMHFTQSRERVTEAFGPLAEATWDEKFKPEFVYPIPASQIAGAVFRTPGGKIWLLHDYDVARGRVQYVISDPSVVVTLTIDLTAAGSGCVAHMSYDVVALDEQGAAHAATLEAHADEMGHDIHDAVESYLATAKGTHAGS
jgi:hypothetical protein